MSRGKERRLAALAVGASAFLCPAAASAFVNVSVGGHEGAIVLFFGDGFGTSSLGFGAGDTCICFCLIGLQPSPDILTHVDVSNIDRNDRKGRLGIQPTLQDCLGDQIGVFQDLVMRVRRTNGGNDALADAGNHRFLGRTSDELFQVGSHRDSSADL